ncbi:MAG: hypothetical protein GW809_01620 [Bacteroidetes bacterium]|nr:hypothetical protein [Bacteroidota bacterium]NCQ10850.1 hypothetical protein [Bacteroidota bacterium]
MLKFLFILLLGICSILTSSAQNQNPNYDAKLAQKLNADDYGMKSFFFVILKSGANPPELSKIVKDSLMTGHLNNIGELAKSGKLVVAGPFGKNELTYRGLFILNTSSLDDAKQIIASDPAIKSGIFDVELLPWYGSAALGEYLPSSDKIWKIKP